MSRATILIMGLVLAGLIVSPALAQTTVTFRDQHVGPDYDPGTPDPTISNYSYLIQYSMYGPDYTYWRAPRQHTDQYNSYGMVPANGRTYAPMLEFSEMFGADTSTYEGSYVGQVPHGAVINSAELTLWRTNYGADMINIGVRQVLDPDDLGHWGINGPDDHDPDSGWMYGCGWEARNSLIDTADPETDIPWNNAGDSLWDIVGAAESTVDYWYGGSGMYAETWTMENMTQNWADCLASRQGFLMISDSGGGEIFGGQNGYDVRQTLVISFTPSLGGDADKGGAVDVGDLGVLAGNYGTDTGLACWGTGDFSGDGNVDVADLGILAGNYGTGGSGEGTVPEPMTMTLLGLGALALIRRRK